MSLNWIQVNAFAKIILFFFSLLLPGNFPPVSKNLKINIFIIFKFKSLTMKYILVGGPLVHSKMQILKMHHLTKEGNFNSFHGVFFLANWGCIWSLQVAVDLYHGHRKCRFETFGFWKCRFETFGYWKCCFETFGYWKCRSETFGQEFVLSLFLCLKQAPKMICKLTYSIA